ncbi:MAG: substrate-binding periplasmic protein [Marinobacter sp.]
MRPKQPGLKTVFLVLLLILPSPQVLANADTLGAPEPVKLVTGPHYPPFAADYLPSKGLGPFLVMQVLKASGYQSTVELRPWKRAYREALQNKYDAVLPYIETSERKDQYLFTDAVFEANTYVYVTADSKIDASSLEGLKGLVYCNPLGFADSSALQEMRSKGEIIRISSANLKTCFKMLMAGRADFIKINHDVADYVVHNMDLSADKIRSLPFIVEHISLHVMVPKTRKDAQALVSSFDSAFLEMKKTGKLHEWTKTYLETINPKIRTAPE